jgi:pyridoxal phosphate enzyme (YggS family)
MMLAQIQSELAPYHAQLVAVSKTHAEEKILKLYQEGQRIFGENRALEVADKYESLPKDIEWHFIGHLQTNKVKYVAPFISLIHGVDRFKVLKEINKQARRNERTINCLLQFHIAEEESKFGFDLAEAEEMLSGAPFQQLENIQIVGVMGMATFTSDHEQVRKEFKQLKSIFDTLKNKYFSKEDTFREISMGMSGDYPIALEEGSTMVRIGTLLFGKR